ncbi:hypothetical protein [Streptomyces sp. AK04-3B]|nr:hypothetical protein [Streptomyces sp. AK04-3B]
MTTSCRKIAGALGLGLDTPPSEDDLLVIPVVGVPQGHRHWSPH